MQFFVKIDYNKDINQKDREGQMERKPNFHGTGEVDQFNNLDGYTMNTEDWGLVYEALVEIVNASEPNTVTRAEQVLNWLFIKAQEANNLRDAQAKNNPLPIVSAGIVPTCDDDDFDGIPF